MSADDLFTKASLLLSERDAEISTLRARVAELEAALRAWDSLLGMPKARLFAELKAATRRALSGAAQPRGEGELSNWGHGSDCPMPEFGTTCTCQPAPPASGAPAEPPRERCAECHGTGEVPDFGSAVVACPSCGTGAARGDG